VPNQPLVVSGSACLDSADLSQGQANSSQEVTFLPPAESMIIEPKKEAKEKEAMKSEKPNSPTAYEED
jgi:hypothetical protein